MATGPEGAQANAEESAAAAAATLLPMNHEAAAARPASSKTPGVTPRSEQGRNNKNACNRARRKERAEGNAEALDTVPPETEA